MTPFTRQGETFTLKGYQLRPAAVAIGPKWAASVEIIGRDSTEVFRYPKYLDTEASAWHAGALFGMAIIEGQVDGVTPPAAPNVEPLAELVARLSAEIPEEGALITAIQDELERRDGTRPHARLVARMVATSRERADA